jgi:hypothetical protein
MAEHEEWTAGDDARLRAALGTLRADVEAVPLADPRFVRARGSRRRRQRTVGWAAAAAAAVVVAGAVGYGQLGRDATLPTPPAGTPTSTASSTTTSPPTSATTTSPTATSPTTSGEPTARSEEMPVSGPGPVPSWELFVAASQWASQDLTGGARTSAGPGALEGSTAVASCETDDQQAGIGGRVGVVSVRVGTGSTGYLGRQRVQLDEATDAAVQKEYVDARLSEAQTLFAQGCTFGNGTVRATEGPSRGTYRLDTVFADGSPTVSEWVGVTAQRTRGAVSTVVLTRVTEPDRAFDELERLLSLARQK